MADYVISGAGTSSANGDYFEYTTSDGVPNYKKADSSSYLYRVGGIWAIFNVLDEPDGFAYYYSETGAPNADTPPLEVYQVGTGDAPGGEVVEGAGTNCQINIGDAWKTITGIQINIGDAWKSVTGMKINIGDSWLTIF